CRAQVQSQLPVVAGDTDALRMDQVRDTSLSLCLAPIRRLDPYLITRLDTVLPGNSWWDKDRSGFRHPSVDHVLYPGVSHTVKRVLICEVILPLHRVKRVALYVSIVRWFVPDRKRRVMPGHVFHILVRYGNADPFQVLLKLLPAPGQPVQVDR